MLDVATLFPAPIVTYADEHCVCLERSARSVTQYGIRWTAKPEAGTFWYNSEAQRDSYRHAFA